MNNEDLAAENPKQVDELCEDMEVVGPGLMLSEARKKLSLSIDEVSTRLNFRRNLVEEIEKDIFDQSLPATFNRGYLRNYAKLVSVDIDEIMSAYDMLGVAEVQRSEMQSFSNLTEKQAEHSRLMWFSYLIAAILFGLMVVWWLQEPKLSVNLFDNPKQEQKQEQEQEISNDVSNAADLSVAKTSVVALEQSKEQAIETDKVTKSVESTQKDPEPIITEPIITEVNVGAVLEEQLEAKIETSTEQIPNISTAVFTFSGDCWVNIHDATGERIAWGVKKLGYVMTVTGIAPLKVILGKPELATIMFNGEPINMSPFNVGNIAKFTLPLSL